MSSITESSIALAPNPQITESAITEIAKDQASSTTHDIINKDSDANPAEPKTANDNPCSPEKVIAQVLPAAFLGNDAPSGTPAAMLLEGSDAAPKDPAPLSGSKRRAEEEVTTAVALGPTSESTDAQAIIVKKLRSDTVTDQAPDAAVAAAVIEVAAVEAAAVDAAVAEVAAVEAAVVETVEANAEVVAAPEVSAEIVAAVEVAAE